MLSSKTRSLAEMLDEIKSETVAQLMSSVLYQTSPLGSTGLPGLDVQLLSGTTNRASPSSSLNRGDVIEIQGPAASGKTRLVYYLVMQCILPNKISLPEEIVPSRVDVGGWEKGAVILDTDGRCNIERLKLLLSDRLEEALSRKIKTTKPIVQDAVTKSLQRLHIFRPKSSASLAATLFRMPKYLAEHSSAEEIALLVIDSISSFYWIDRYNFEQRRQGPSGRRERESPLHNILVALQEFRVRYGPATVFTNWGLSPASKGSTTDSSVETSTPFYRQHLHPFPAPFEIPTRILPNAHMLPPITHHITLTPTAVDKIPTEASSLQEALELSEKGCAGVRRSVIRGILRIVETGSVTTFTWENHSKT